MAKIAWSTPSTRPATPQPGWPRRACRSAENEHADRDEHDAHQRLAAATATIPVVFTTVSDPIGTGTVKSLSRPGANLTGVHSQATDISGKRLQILKDIVAGIRSIAVLLNQDAPFTTVALPELRIAADARGQRLELCDANTVTQLKSDLEAAVKAGAAGLTVFELPCCLAFAGKSSISRLSFGWSQSTPVGILSVSADSHHMDRIVGSRIGARRSWSTKY